MALPEAYRWLADVAEPPRMIAEALKLYGVHEGVGPADNPVILAWAKEVGLDDVYTHDAEPWCGLLCALVAKRADKVVPDNPLWALNWLKFGRIVPDVAAGLGDVLVFERRDAAGKLIGGHVGLYVGSDDTAFHVLGGNTADSVSIARIAKGRLRGVRRPLYRVQPVSVKPIHLAATGGLSTNEA